MQGEVALAGTVEGAVDTPVQRQDQGHGVLGDGEGRIGRHSHHAQAQLLGCLQVDVVVTGRAQGDQACAASGQLLQYRRREVVVNKGADHFAVVGQGRGIQPQVGMLERQAAAGWQGGGAEAVAVIGLAAEQHDAHGVASGYL